MSATRRYDLSKPIDKAEIENQIALFNKAFNDLRMYDSRTEGAYALLGVFGLYGSVSFWGMLTMDSVIALAGRFLHNRRVFVAFFEEQLEKLFQMYQSFNSKDQTITNHETFVELAKALERFITTKELKLWNTWDNMSPRFKTEVLMQPRHRHNFINDKAKSAGFLTYLSGFWQKSPSSEQLPESTTLDQGYKFALKLRDEYIYLYYGRQSGQSLNPIVERAKEAVNAAAVLAKMN